MSQRVILISNRLPVTVKAAHGALKIQPSAGGLASSLRSFHKEKDSLWVGWPGNHEDLSAAMLEDLRKELSDLRAMPVPLTPEEIRSFYEGFSNSVLWPLFHFQPELLPLDSSADWESFRDVNEKFADAVASIYRNGDILWVHDYQLVLLPGALRRRIPHASIGFFLHIPFPPSEIFRILPGRSEILHGMLGADVIGFHTYSYLRHFSFCLTRLLGLNVDIDHVSYEGREVRLGAFPVCIDPQAFVRWAQSGRVQREFENVRAEHAGKRLLLGIDRLDYIKGIPRRLLALERLLERHPEYRGRLKLIQVIVPSRDRVDTYAAYRRQIDEMVGRINGAYASVNDVPIHHLHRSIPESQMVALYRAADVMLVTSTRDGMNLVAKEFVASRIDEDGVLVLSEMTGAAAELGEALQVNPYDVCGTAEAIHRALQMGEPERRMRMSALRRRVLASTTRDWASSFICEVSRVHEENRMQQLHASTRENTTHLLERIRKEPRLVLLLDYDGTLVPFSPIPELAAPDPGLLDLLLRLAQRNGTSVHVVSGRRRDVIESWLGGLPIGLHAEYGFWSRFNPASGWVARGDLSAEWKEKLMPILRRYAINTPGSMIEEKTAALAWHYRMADPEFGPLQAKELHVYVAEMFSNAPVEVVMGDKVLEVRAAGLNKGSVVKRIQEGLQEPCMMVAIGDDLADEDLFRALPQTGIGIRIGKGPTKAGHILPDHRAARALLHGLLPDPV